RLGQRHVGGVRLRGADHLPGLALVAPVACARLFGGEELLDRHRPVLRPAAAGRAEVGNAGGRRETGPGEDDDVPGRAPGRPEVVERAQSGAQGISSYAGTVRNSVKSSASTRRSIRARASSIRTHALRLSLTRYTTQRH